MEGKTSIKQIMPGGDGFVIVWYSDSPDKNGNWFFTTRLIALALIGDYSDKDLGGKEDRVFPLDDMGGYLDIIEDESWQYIIHKDEITLEIKRHWNEEAKGIAERKAKREAAVEDVENWLK